MPFSELARKMNQNGWLNVQNEFLGCMILLPTHNPIDLNDGLVTGAQTKVNIIISQQYMHHQV